MISAWINPYNEKSGTLETPDTSNIGSSVAVVMASPSSGTTSTQIIATPSTTSSSLASSSTIQDAIIPDIETIASSSTTKTTTNADTTIENICSSLSNSIAIDKESDLCLQQQLIDDGFHSDGGSVTPPPSPSSSAALSTKSGGGSSSSSSASSISSTSDHGSLESVHASVRASAIGGNVGHDGGHHQRHHQHQHHNHYHHHQQQQQQQQQLQLQQQKQQHQQQQQQQQQRKAVLSYEQCQKLSDVMSETVAIHGRGNFPTLEVRLCDLVQMVQRKLELDIAAGGAGMRVRDIRLNGGCASHVLGAEPQPYNDLDLIFGVEFSSGRHYDRVKSAVLATLCDLLPEGVSKRRITQCSLKEAYVGKMVKVNNTIEEGGDRWSLISLGNSHGHKNVELKFVDTMRRQFEFSVDSFQVILDSLLRFYDYASPLPITENFYPTVIGESVFGDFHEALYHLEKKLISTRQPEEIRGGGLLKYCNLLVRNYTPVDYERIKSLEKYMCSRFFIDFPDISIQTVKLEAYLRNHFWGIEEEPLQYQYLMHLHDVVETSTVCLMGHERRQTLLLIETLAVQVYYREQQRQQMLQHHHQQQQQQQQQHQHQQQQQHILHHQQQQQQQQQHLQQQTIHIQASPSSQSNLSTPPPPPPPLPSAMPTMPPASMSQLPPSIQSLPPTAALTISPAISIHHSSQMPSQAQQIAGIQAMHPSASSAQQVTALPPAGLLYANGIYYAPVMPATFCTCTNTWLST